MRIYIGYDPRDNNAYAVLKHSILKNTREEVDIIPIWEPMLRQKNLYWRTYRVDEKGQYWDDKDRKPFSTMFSFARFAVPLLEDFGDEVVLFMDSDMMIRVDIKELFSLWDPEYAVMCVKHKQKPEESVKMDNKLQQPYPRKNWSSLMLMRPSMCNITPYILNNWSGADLHKMLWVPEEEIGALPKEWNFLAGHDDPSQCDPKNIHHTLGTPDMLGLNAKVTQWDDEWWSMLDESGGAF